MRRPRPFHPSLLTALLVLATSACIDGDLGDELDEDQQLRAEDAPASTDGQLDAELSQAELEDLRFIARERGWTLEQAKARIGWQPAFVELVDELRQRYPEDLAGARIDADADPRALLLFRADAPTELVRDPRLVELPIELVTERGYTEAGLLAQTQDTHRALLDAGLGEPTSSYDVETGLIEVELPLGGRFESLAELRPSLPKQARADNVRIRLVDALPGHDFDTVYGGAQLLYNGSPSCTAGFGVKQGAVEGMLTAGHCPNDLDLQNQPLAPINTGTFRGEYRGAWGDFQWHSFADQESRYFYTDWNQKREAWRVGSVVKGQTVCKFGRTTGKHCDEVKSVNVQQGFDGNLVMMKNMHADFGDSGGVWYYGNTIYGIVKGAKTSFFKWRDTWSQLIYVDEALGLELLLCEPDSCQLGECGSTYVGCGIYKHCGTPQTCGCISDLDCSAPDQCHLNGGACEFGTCLCYL